MTEFSDIAGIRQKFGENRESARMIKNREIWQVWKYETFLNLQMLMLKILEINTYYFKLCYC